MLNISSVIKVTKVISLNLRFLAIRIAEKQTLVTLVTGVKPCPPTLVTLIPGAQDLIV